MAEDRGPGAGISTKGYSKILDPEVVQHNLTIAGLYLVAYELLRGSMVGQFRSFFSDPGSPDGNGEYAREVLTRHRDTLMASCLWLREMKVLTDADLGLVEQVRTHRNEIAHELVTFVVDDTRDMDVSDLPRIRALMRKVDTWWILEVHVTTDPSFDGQTIRPEDVASGRILLLDHLIATVSSLHGGAAA